MRFMEEVVAIRGTEVVVRNVYSLREDDPRRVRLGGPRLRHASPTPPCTTSCGRGSARVHVLGDAYAPRRLVFATRQAYALAEQIVRA